MANPIITSEERFINLSKSYYYLVVLFGKLGKAHNKEELKRRCNSMIEGKLMGIRSNYDNPGISLPAGNYTVRFDVRRRIISVCPAGKNP